MDGSVKKYHGGGGFCLTKQVSLIKLHFVAAAEYWVVTRWREYIDNCKL